MTKKQLLEKIKCLEYNQKVLNETIDQEYKNIKKYEKELKRLAEIGKATEKAYQEGYVVAEVEQIVDPFNENALRIVCYHAFGTIEKLVEYLNESEVE